MAERDVIISIRGRQKYEGAEDSQVELVTDGVLRRETGIFTLSYQESEVTGMEGTLTTIQVEGDRVTLLRVGQFNTEMVFQEGRRHMSVYETPYGSLAVGINTRKLRSRLSDAGGDIEIGYNIEIDHQVAGMNLFQISVREKKTAGLTQ